MYAFFGHWLNYVPSVNPCKSNVESSARHFGTSKYEVDFADFEPSKNVLNVGVQHILGNDLSNTEETEKFDSLFLQK